MDNQLTDDDIELILTSLKFTRTAFENTQYPSYELRQTQLQRVTSAMTNMRQLRDQFKIQHKREAEEGD